MSRDDIIRAMASATSLSEQIALAAELDAQADAMRRTAAAERDLDWAGTTVAQTFEPVPVYTHHTAATDWLDEADVSGGDNAHHAILAEASVWFQGLDSDVKADAHEYVEQARGMARRTAGKYGEQADTAANSFVEYATFLNRQVLAASGLPQVQQLVDARENPGQTPLPQDVFDNFAPPVHPINQGVDGSQQQSLGPGAEEAMSESGQGAAGRPSEHDDGQGEISEPYLETPSAQAPNQISAALAPPSMAINHSYTLEQFLQAEAAREAGGAAPFVRESAFDPDEDDDDDLTKRGDTDKDYAGRKEAASGLDQVQQNVDSFEKPKPTSLPTDVMFPIDQPWPEENSGQYIDQGGESMPAPAAGRPSAHQSARKQADMYGGGDAPHAAPGTETPVANSPATTPPRANDGDYQRGLAEGQADAQAGAQPSFSDVSSTVSDYVRGYSEGFGNTHPALPPQDVPGSMGGDNGQGANFARIEREREKPLVMAKRVKADGVSEEKRERAKKHHHTLPGTDKFPIENKEDLENAKHDIGRTNEPKDKVRRYINERAKELGAPELGESKAAMLTVSASLISKDVTQDGDFQRGYRYARSWKPGRDLVALGSNGEEAGIYAGITDNPRYQRDFVIAHRKGSTEFPELTQRLRSHKLVTGNLQRQHDDLLIKGLYVQAATSLDLDTMGPTTSADPEGATPFMGPGTIPPLAGAPGSAAQAGGPSPYNGAEPMGEPVTPNPLLQTRAPSPTVPESSNGVSMVGDSSLLTKNPQATAFRKRVQAAKLAMRQKNQGN